ncbi:MAG: DUF4375 domain-containing protein [Clostridia bacterium]|nr:DUF4375 domain-containing protein [Clostridia bacterium]
MFSFLKKLFAQRDLIADTVAAELNEEDEKYRSMTAEELCALEDDELVSAAWARADAVMSAHEDEKDGLLALNEHQRVLYVAYVYEMEVNNGGLCQYFANSSRAGAPYLTDALEQLKAEKHRALFERFVSENQIDVNDLSRFAFISVRQFQKMEKEYSFDEFDDSFYGLEDLGEPMALYVREYLSFF